MPDVKTLLALLRTLLPLLVTLFCASSARGQTAPSNATASIVSHTSVKLQWTDNSNNEAGFELGIYDPNTMTVTSWLGSVAANSTSVTITSLTPGTTYYFAVFVITSFTGNTANLGGGTAASGITAPTESLTRFGFQGVAGQALSVAILTPTANAGSSAPLTSLTVTGQPAWLTYTSATKTFSGTPPSAGAYPVSVTATYSDAYTFTRTVTIRVLPAASGPVALGTMPTPTLTPNTSPTTIDLNTLFTDPDTPQAVRLTTNKGNIDVILYPAATPATVTNFLSYANASGQASYDNAVIPRSIPGFVIQGGGYKPAGGTSFNSVTRAAAITNEPGLNNVPGTIAMARSSAVNSATSEWFINLADNTSNLDTSNEGFTVFGRVGLSSYNAVNAIATLPTHAYTGMTVDDTVNTGTGINNPFNDCPMNAATAPASMDQSLLVKSTTVRAIQPLSYQVVSNSSPAALGTSISGTTLALTPTAAGTASVVIRATDLDGNTLDRTLTAQVQWSFTTWTAQQTFATGTDGLTADPDKDGMNNLLEYALLTSPKSANGPATSISKVSSGGHTYLALTFPLRLGATDLTYVVQASSSLAAGSWTDIWTSTQGSGAAQVQSWATGTDRATVTIRDTTATTSAPRRFLRLSVRK
jgi:cyclophilin family peptidyl-prolyl cis-trans isomerase